MLPLPDRDEAGEGRLIDRVREFAAQHGRIVAQRHVEIAELEAACREMDDLNRKISEAEHETERALEAAAEHDRRAEVERQRRVAAEQRIAALCRRSPDGGKEG